MATNWSDVEQARTTAEGQAKTALDYTTTGYTLADELRQALGERFGEGTVASKASEAAGNYLKSAPQSRSEVANLVNAGNIMSPSQINAILAAKKTAALVPLIGANFAKESTLETMEDLINAGTNAWKAKTSYQTGLADLAQKSYSSLLNELLQRSQEERYNQPSYSLQEVGGKVYNYNPKTGKLEEISGVSTQTGGDVETWANLVMSGQANMLDVPDKLVTQVYTIVNQKTKEAEETDKKNAELAKQNSWWNKTTSGISDYVSNLLNYLQSRRKGGTGT